MKFTGIVTAISPLASGTSRSGKAWRKIEVCLTYDNSKPEWPKAIVFSVMNDNIEKFAMLIGGEYDVEIDFSVREYQGRHYLSASCWKAEPKMAMQPQQQPQQQVYAQQNWQSAYPQPQPQARPTLPQTQDDDIPF